MTTGTGEQPSPSGERRVRRSRGRPVGSVSLTPEIEQTILTYIGGGAFAHAAAEAAGISARTFHDWIARGEGRDPSQIGRAHV